MLSVSSLENWIVENRYHKCTSSLQDGIVFGVWTMSVAKSLEELNSVNWAKLTHTYGRADDVPNLLRRVASDNEPTRDQAIWNLYGNIFHQGSRYQASPHAVPFIFGLLRRPEQKSRVPSSQTMENSIEKG